MVSMKEVTKQLRAIGCDYALWGRSEIRELTNILMDEEKILQAVNGYYDGGFALLCLTNYRVLVVDKKPLALTVEDLRYDMIAEVDFSARVFTSVFHIYTPMRTLIFTSWSMRKLRASMNYIQQRIMELRNNDYLMNQFAQQPTSGSVRTAPTKRRPRQAVPQMELTHAEATEPTADFDAYRQPAKPLRNPYTKVPLLTRRRRYPSFY
ncbi:hypothetical protein CSA80_04360 [Candidatus Saccharibacteria bacterium]|nr:MAG: hypothetical protein CR973_01565 [Candidatus Saccharibacteria bacterium]PID98903.1 MAG: hypothetical protein CSA80_04360 [Candidatus Saccharibacteria bacterium]